MQFCSVTPVTHYYLEKGWVQKINQEALARNLETVLNRFLQGLYCLWPPSAWFCCDVKIHRFSDFCRVIVAVVHNEFWIGCVVEGILGLMKEFIVTIWLIIVILPSFTIEWASCDWRGQWNSTVWCRAKFYASNFQCFVCSWRKSKPA